MLPTFVSVTTKQAPYHQDPQEGKLVWTHNSGLPEYAWMVQLVFCELGWRMCRTLLSARPAAALNNLTTLYTTVFVFCFVLLSQKVAGGLCLSSTGRLPSRSSLPATPSLLWIVFLVHSHQGSQPFNASVLAEEGR